jgi:hypothetical protein
MNIKSRIKRLEMNSGAGECKSNCPSIIVIGTDSPKQLCPVCRRKPCSIIVPTLNADGTFGKLEIDELPPVNKVYVGIDYNKV